MKNLFASLIFLLSAAFALQAQTNWFVIPGAPTTGTGNAWSDPIDFQTAITSASAGDIVFVAQGTYQPASGQSFTMKEGVKIYGGFAGTETSLNQRDLSAGHISTLKGNNSRVIWNNINGLTAAALLDGFTITNGNGAYGAGMFNNTASPTISNCIFAGNNGGGMWNASSSAAVINCIFLSNTGGLTTYGGGIGNASSNGASIINCIFWGNTGSQAGGVYIDDLGPTSPSIINCTFWGNTASMSGGIGGAINCADRSAPKIQNCIVWGNSSGIHLASTAYPASVLTNNIIQDIYSGNLIVDPLFVNPTNPAGADNIFGTADDGLMLQAGSPAFNAGTADITGLNLPATDIAGATRVQGNKIDIGAYESSFTCSGGFTTLYVDSSIVASGDGGSWTTAFKTFNEALAAANQCTNVGSILVAKGTYQPAAGLEFNMVQHVKTYGGFPSGGGSFAQRDTAINKTILKGNGRNVIYNYGLDATALLDGFTVTGGTANSSCGMFNLTASPTINNCIFSGNGGPSNGGGGGMYNQDGSSPVISNCIFSDNSTSTSGGGGGGAIFNTNASPAISYCIFYNNTASYGGAIYNNTATNSVIRNTVFAGNVSANDGAAIANYGNALTLTNVTFANNNAGGGGGAIDNYGSALFVTNAVFWANSASDNNKDIWWETGTRNITYSYTQVNWTGTGNILGSSSPFVNAATPAGADGIWGTTDDGLTLQAGSTAIDAGTPDITGLGLGSTDITGNPRVLNSVIDMGAYEYNIATLPITLISFTGSLHNGVADLQWLTGVETGFNHFEVEKSTDGLLFLPQGEVAVQRSVSSYTYSMSQQEPTAYYRLKMVDNDGSAEYSRIISLSQSTGNGIIVYPNPATNQINIKVAEAGSISIYTADGKLVKTLAMQAGVNTVELSQLSAGMYYGVMKKITVWFIKK